MRQMPVKAGREERRAGEAHPSPDLDETNRPRWAQNAVGRLEKGPGPLLKAVLERENLRQAMRKVRSNGGAAGVDGLDIDQTSARLVVRLARDPRKA